MTESNVTAERLAGLLMMAGPEKFAGITRTFDVQVPELKQIITLALEALALRTPSDGEVVAWRGDIEVAGEHTRKFTALKRVSEIWAEEGITVTPLYARPQGMEVMDVDALAQIIRRVDGDNSLGAGALAEAILSALTGKE